MYISESLLIIGLWLVGEKPSNHSFEAMLLSDRLCSIISVLAAMLPRPLVLFTLPTWFGRSSNFVILPPAIGLSLFYHSNSSICLHAGGSTSFSGCHCLFIKFFGQVSSSQSILRLAQHGIGIPYQYIENMYIKLCIFSSENTAGWLNTERQGINYISAACRWILGVGKYYYSLNSEIILGMVTANGEH